MILNRTYDARERLVKKTSSGISELRTTVRLGDFGRDAQSSLTCGRMCLSIILYCVYTLEQPESKNNDCPAVSVPSPHP